jgi:phosphohistidine phosphatase SixA
MTRPRVSTACIVVALSLAMSSALAAQAPSPAPPRLVVLVRHAEKAAEKSDDPALSEAGSARAKALEAALHDAGVTAIVTTQLRRTRETAMPLASARGISPEVVRVGSGLSAHVEAVVAAVRRHSGGIVLVVGHSNTIPAIVAALGGPRMPDLCESAYSDIFVIVPGDDARLVRSRYGASDPAPGPDCK